jgi:hypothetical protein
MVFDSVADLEIRRIKTAVVHVQLISIIPKEYRAAYA